MNRYSKENDVESSSDEDICVLLQALEVDGKEVNAMEETRAPEKDGCENYGKQTPQEHRYDTYQHQENGRVSRPGYQSPRTPGYSENKASVRPQYQWIREFRSPVYSYQQANRCCSGRPDHKEDARADQLPGNGRVRRAGVSYHLAKTQGYSENGACAGPRADQLRENGRVRRPTRLYQQASSPGYPNHGASARAYNQQQPDSRTYVQITEQTSSRGYLNQQAKVRGYSNNLANDRDQHQAHHRVQDRRVIRSSSQITRISICIHQRTQRNEMVQPRRGMEWSRHRSIRLPPIQQSGTRIQQRSQNQGLVAERQCGRQEFCEEANRSPAKRNGVRHN